jgi:hypothetical protein
VAKLSLKKFNVLYFKVGFELKTSRWYIQYLYYNKIMNFYWTLCKIVLHYFVNALLKSSTAKFTNTKYWVFCQKKLNWEENCRFQICTSDDTSIYQILLQYFIIWIVSTVIYEKEMIFFLHTFYSNVNTKDSRLAGIYPLQCRRVFLYSLNIFFSFFLGINPKILRIHFWKKFIATGAQTI